MKFANIKNDIAFKMALKTAEKKGEKKAKIEIAKNLLKAGGNQQLLNNYSFLLKVIDNK